MLPAKIRTKVVEAFRKADADDATPDDGQRLRELLREHPDALGVVSNMSGAVVDRVLADTRTTEASRVMLRGELDRLRQGLGDDEASPVERLLIDQVVICYPKTCNRRRTM